MNHTATAAFVIAGGLVLLGGVTGWFQLRGWRALRARTHVPSDELAYLRGRYRRRGINSVLFVVIGGLLAGAFASGLEPRVDAMVQPKAADPDQPDPPDEPKAKREMTPEEKQLVRVWVGYWVLVVALVFVVLGLAFADAVATRRYAFQQYQVLREEHQAKLRRDLAVHRAQREANRGGRGGNRMGGDS